MHWEAGSAGHAWSGVLLSGAGGAGVGEGVGGVEGDGETDGGVDGDAVADTDPTPGLTRPLLKTAAPRTTAATRTAAVNPQRALVEACETMVSILPMPGPGRTCRVRGRSAWTASRTRSGSGVTPSNDSR